MSHAEAVTLHPAAGATDTIVRFASGLRYADLADEVRYYARRHLLDTVGVMIAGAPGDVATNAETMLASVRSGAARFRCRAARSGTTCSMPRSSAARRRTASSSTTATASARRIAAAPSCPPRSASAISARSPAPN